MIEHCQKMVDIIPSSQLVIGNGAFSIVYRARLKLVSDDYCDISVDIATQLLPPENLYGFMEFSLDIFHDCTFVHFFKLHRKLLIEFLRESTFVNN